MIPFPNFDPVAVHVGPLSVRWYGIMYLIGFAGAWWLGQRRAHRPGSPVSPAQMDDVIFYGALGVILGGRIGYMLFYGYDQLLKSPWALFRIWEGGMSFHGGLLGVVIAMMLYGRRAGVSFLALADFIAPLVPVGLGPGRLGNFINGELWGKPTDLPWGFLVDGVGRHASQLYEALLEGLVLFVLLWTFSARPRPVMATSGLFLLVYGMFRFGIEFVRLPDSHIGYLAFGWLTMGQVLSVPMIFAGLLVLALAYRHPASAAQAS